jgi:hypothetical protein
MRIGLRILVGLALLPCLDAHAAPTELNLTCITKDLPAGAKVWLQIEPEHYRSSAPTPATLGEVSGAPEPASGDSIWQFEVPAGGSAPASTHTFTFPIDLQPTRAKVVSSIRLRVSFKIDAPGQPSLSGQLIKAALGMPVLADNSRLARCVRLREEGDKLILESAPDCSDSSFASLGHNGRIRFRQPMPIPPSLAEPSSAPAPAGGDSQFAVRPKDAVGSACPSNLEPASGGIVPSAIFPGGASSCPDDVRGCGPEGSCCYICYLTLFSCTGDPVTHVISCDCEYDDCYTNCV